MSDLTLTHALWALALGAVSAVSLPLGSLVGLRVRFPPSRLAAFAAFGAGALIAALSVELVAPTALALGHDADPHARTHFFALILGGALGGLLFVALDSVVNSKGGYLRKTATTLAHVAKLRREEVEAVMQGVLELRPFDALPRELSPVLAGVLRPVEFAAGQPLPGSEAWIVLEGEVEFEVAGRPHEVAGPGTVLGALPLLVPGIEALATATTRTPVRCLAMRREDLDHLKALSPAFDEACRALAGERLEVLQQHLATRMKEAAEWTRAAASALRLGGEVPAMALRRAHAEGHGSPMAVWLGILLDGIPESLVIGAGLFVMLQAHPAPETLNFLHVIPYTLVAGLFLSNFPEALSSSANMLDQKWSPRRIFLMWFALMVITAVGSGLGFLLAGVLAETWLVFAEGLAAGAMLTMIAAAMIPEAAVAGRPNVVGLSTLGGFLAAVLFKLLE